MSEFYQPRLDGFGYEGDNVYGGTMSKQEFYNAEFMVDECMPYFDTEREEQVITIPTEDGNIDCRQYNSIVVLYEEEWSDWTHVQVKQQDEEGNMVVRLLFGLDEDTVDLFHEMDFSFLMPPREPINFVKEQHYYYARGTEAMSEILKQIIEVEQE